MPKELKWQKKGNAWISKDRRFRVYPRHSGHARYCLHDRQMKITHTFSRIRGAKQYAEGVLAE
jgi:hypothetical protein